MNSDFFCLEGEGVYKYVSKSISNDARSAL